MLCEWDVILWYNQLVLLCFRIFHLKINYSYYFIFCFIFAGMLENSLKILPIVIVCTFISFFRLGLGPIPWFITTELIGADHSNRAQSCIVSYSWILSFVVMKTFVMLVDEWPVALWLGYTVLSVFGYLFILFFVPETNNKNADEIRLSLAKTYQINSSWLFCINKNVKHQFN